MPSSSNKAPPLRATKVYPYTYRLLLTTIEPLFTLLGILTVLYDPSLYFHNLTRSTGLSSGADNIDHNAPTYDPSTAFLYTHLIAGWLVFTFNEAVVLRLVDDARIWRLMAMGMLVSDVVYCYGCVQAVGGWRAYWEGGYGEVGVMGGGQEGAKGWGWDEWSLLVTTAPMVLGRMGMVLGIGVRDGREDEERKFEMKVE